MFFQRHTSVGVITVITTYTGLALDSTGAVNLGEFILNFGRNAGLTSSRYKTDYAYGPSGLNENPRRIPSRSCIMMFSCPASRNYYKAL